MRAVRMACVGLAVLSFTACEKDTSDKPEAAASSEEQLDSQDLEMQTQNAEPAAEIEEVSNDESVIDESSNTPWNRPVSGQGSGPLSGELPPAMQERGD